VAVIAAIYAAVLIPFNALTIIPGITSIRPANVFPVIFGIMFGPAAAWMNRLRDAGCRFALDDFGVGFASFSCLRALPVDFVKLDGEIIKGIEKNATDAAWVKAMVVVGQTLGKQIVAESIETAGVAEQMAGLGVEYGQGHHWAHPAERPVRTT
jgi:EAL domain-containing protein (putative c-di-GMP-specific phosphodiesterase class I)